MSPEGIPSKPAASEPPHGGGQTRLGSTSVFKGTLQGHEDTVIEGQFQGRIILPSSSLTIGRGAKVEAEVEVRTLNLQGELTGAVAAANLVMISETARMNGDVRTAKISISSGAQFKGGIKIEKS
jgi:cytoskeletal protein CcmA (bactofilin family)